MKCQARVRVSERRRRGSGKPYTHVAFIVMPYDLLLGGTGRDTPYFKEALATTEQCNGEIKCEVRAEDEPFYGGASARLDITYKCQRCGNTAFGRYLPHDDATFVEMLVNAAIAETPNPLEDM